MGVRSLTSLLRSDEELFVSRKLHDTKVIIDGNNLRYFLFQSCRGVKSSLNGDYLCLESHMRKFFETFAKCNIECVVILDGGHDLPRKRRTLINRLRDQSKLAVNWESKGNFMVPILPIFASNIFLKVINACKNVEVVQTNFEADAYIAHLAIKTRWPLLSNDSDFFIFEVPNVVPLDFVDFEAMFEDTDSDKLFHYINIHQFDRDAFRRKYPFKDDQMIFLAAALMGNDFVGSTTFDKFFQQIHVPKKKNQNQRKNRFVGLLEWLSRQQSLDSCLDFILSVFKKDERARLKSILLSTLDQYRNSVLERVSHLGISDEVKSLVDCQVEDWFMQELRQGVHSSWVLDLCFNAECFMLNQIERRESPSSHVFALPILKATCQLIRMLREDKKESFRVCHRHSTTMRHTDIDLKDNKCPDICLKVMRGDEEGWELRAFEIIYHQLEVSKETIGHLEALSATRVEKLFLLALHFWSKREESVSNADVKALAFGIYTHLRRQSMRIPGVEVSHLEGSLALQKLAVLNERHLDAMFIQQMANFQATLYHLDALMTLLMGPSWNDSEQELFHYWHGPLVHRIHSDLLSFEDVDNRTQVLLNFDEVAWHDFNLFLNVSKVFVDKVSDERRQRGRRRRIRSHRKAKDSYDDKLNNRFEVLNLDK